MRLARLGLRVKNGVGVKFPRRGGRLKQCLNFEVNLNEILELVTSHNLSYTYLQVLHATMQG